MDITDLLAYEEGFSDKPYYCSQGYPTIGIGLKIGPKNAPLSNYTFRVSKKVAQAFLEEEIVKIREAISSYPWFTKSNEARQNILISMAYQMGVKGLLSFTNTLKFIENEHYIEAASNMLKSKWATQTPNRARRHALVMSTGRMESAYGNNK